MFNVLTLNKISPVGTDRLGANYTFGDDIANPDAVLVRSASMHEMEMPESLLAIARAGAGTNNIPVEDCANKGIVVFNSPGANANAVKELVIAGLLLSSRKIVDGIKWAQTLKGNGDAVAKMIEKGKSQFVGPEIMGKTLGIVGLGAIGILVANAAVALGMNVVGFDPFMSVNNALKLNRHIVLKNSVEEVLTDCDYLTIHVPLTNDTKNMVNAEILPKMKDGVRILNYSRNGLVDEDAVLEGLKSGKVAAYVTDFGDDKILGQEGVTVMPHLGASTPESEDNCAIMAVDEIKDYLENGNITNSVNYPSVTMARTGDVRFCVMHKNTPKILTQVLGAVTENNANVENMESKSRNEIAYTVIDTTGADASVTSAIKAIDGIIRVRVIK